MLRWSENTEHHEKADDAAEGASASGMLRDGTLDGYTPLRTAFVRAMSSPVTDIDGENAGGVKGTDGKARERGKD